MCHFFKNQLIIGDLYDRVEIFVQHQKRVQLEHRLRNGGRLKESCSFTVTASSLARVIFSLMKCQSFALVTKDCLRSKTRTCLGSGSHPRDSLALGALTGCLANGVAHDHGAAAAVVGPLTSHVEAPKRQFRGCKRHTSQKWQPSSRNRQYGQAGSTDSCQAMSLWHRRRTSSSMSTRTSPKRDHPSLWIRPQRVYEMKSTLKSFKVRLKTRVDSS